jgi:hypothetical protein
MIMTIMLGGRVGVQNEVKRSLLKRFVFREETVPDFQVSITADRLTVPLSPVVVLSS